MRLQPLNRFGRWGVFQQPAKRVESAGGKTIDFPDLADRVADDLVTKRLTIKRAAEELPIGNRAELLRWRRLAHQALGEVLP